jgi:predicted nucleotidyltransferase
MKKEMWEIALEKFVSKWKNKKEVVGAIVCGSYITGNPSKHSDIDIHIILDKKVKWRERGNEIIDGILIEYFANPLPQHIKYFEDDFKLRRKINIHMFTTGKVLFDKTGDLKKIIKIAKDWDKKKFEKPNKIPIEISKYSLWDMRDNLEEVYESGNDDFYFVYYNYLNSFFESYSKFLGFSGINVNKLRRFLIDNKDKKKYKMPDFPDPSFVSMFVEAIRLKDKKDMINIYNKLTNYVLTKMKGFNIDGWKIRSPVEK